jgi:hypothetical protein
MNKLDEMTARKDRKEIEKMLTLLLMWLRDAMILNSSGITEGITNADQINTLQKFVGAFGTRNYSEAIDSVEHCIRSVNGNAQIHLNLITMLLSLRRIFLHA